MPDCRTREKARELATKLVGLGSALVAYLGGVDSAYPALAFAAEALRADVLYPVAPEAE